MPSEILPAADRPVEGRISGVAISATCQKCGTVCAPEEVASHVCRPVENSTRAYDLRECADDAERLSRRHEGGVAQILRERADRLRAWADEIAPDTRSHTVAMSAPVENSELREADAYLDQALRQFDERDILSLNVHYRVSPKFITAVRNQRAEISRLRADRLTPEAAKHYDAETVKRDTIGKSEG